MSADPSADPYLAWPKAMQDTAHATLIINLREQRAIRVKLSRQIGIARAVMLRAQAIAEADQTPQSREDYEHVHSTYLGLVFLLENATTCANKIMDDMAGRSGALRARVEATLAATEEEDAEEGQ